MFRDYYSCLYNTQSPLNPSQIQHKCQRIWDYLCALGLPSFSINTVESLNASISKDEFILVVKSLKPHKALGPDGYTEAYYKAFVPILVPRFVVAFNAISDGHALPTYTLGTHMSVISNGGKDHAQCMNYHHIFTFQLRLQLRLPLLHEVMYIDQVGCITTKEVKDNIMRLLDIIHLVYNREHPLCLLLSNAKKHLTGWVGSS